MVGHLRCRPPLQLPDEVPGRRHEFGFGRELVRVVLGEVVDPGLPSPPDQVDRYGLGDGDEEDLLVGPTGTTAGLPDPGSDERDRIFEGGASVPARAHVLGAQDTRAATTPRRPVIPSRRYE